MSHLETIKNQFPDFKSPIKVNQKRNLRYLNSKSKIIVEVFSDYEKSYNQENTIINDKSNFNSLVNIISMDNSASLEQRSQSQ